MRTDFENLQKTVAPSSSLHTLTDTELRLKRLKEAVKSIIELANRAGVKDDNINVAYRGIVQVSAQRKKPNIRKERPTLNAEDLYSFDDYAHFDDFLSRDEY
jgi:hypothetical protein